MAKQKTLPVIDASGLDGLIRPVDVNSIGMTTMIGEIDPISAQTILDTRNTHNRPMSDAAAHAIAADMASGSFHATHQGIAFDEHGTLIDGQTRLRAIVLSQQPQTLQITVYHRRHMENGVVMDVMDLIDCGRKRSTANQIYLTHHVTNSTMLCAAVNAITAICLAGSTPKLTAAQTLKIRDIYGDNINTILGLPWPKTFKAAGVYGTLAFAMGYRKAKTLEFAMRLANQQSDGKACPVATCARWVQNNYGKGGGRGPRMEQILAVASCLCRYYDGQKAEKVIGSEQALDRIRNGQKADVNRVCAIASPSFAILD